MRTQYTFKAQQQQGQGEKGREEPLLLDDFFSNQQLWRATGRRLVTGLHAPARLYIPELPPAPSQQSNRFKALLALALGLDLTPYITPPSARQAPPPAHAMFSSPHAARTVGGSSSKQHNQHSSSSNPHNHNHHHSHAVLHPTTSVTAPKHAAAPQLPLAPVPPPPQPPLCHAAPYPTSSPHASTRAPAPAASLPGRKRPLSSAMQPQQQHTHTPTVATATTVALAANVPDSPQLHSLMRAPKRRRTLGSKPARAQNHISMQTSLLLADVHNSSFGSDLQLCHATCSMPPPQPPCLSNNGSSASCTSEEVELAEAAAIAASSQRSLQPPPMLSPSQLTPSLPRAVPQPPLPTHMPPQPPLSQYPPSPPHPAQPPMHALSIPQQPASASVPVTSAPAPYLSSPSASPVPPQHIPDAPPLPPPPGNKQHAQQQPCGLPQGAIDAEAEQQQWVSKPSSSDMLGGGLVQVVHDGAALGTGPVKDKQQQEGVAEAGKPHVCPHHNTSPRSSTSSQHAYDGELEPEEMSLGEEQAHGHDCESLWPCTRINHPMLTHIPSSNQSTKEESG